MPNTHSPSQSYCYAFAWGFMKSVANASFVNLAIVMSTRIQPTVRFSHTRYSYLIDSFPCVNSALSMTKRLRIFWSLTS